MFFSNLNILILIVIIYFIYKYIKLLEEIKTLNNTIIILNNKINIIQQSTKNIKKVDTKISGQQSKKNKTIHYSDTINTEDIIGKNQINLNITDNDNYTNIPIRIENVINTILNNNNFVDSGESEDNYILNNLTRIMFDNSNGNDNNIIIESIDNKNDSIDNIIIESNKNESIDNKNYSIDNIIIESNKNESIDNKNDSIDNIIIESNKNDSINNINIESNKNDSINNINIESIENKNEIIKNDIIVSPKYSESYLISRSFIDLKEIAKKLNIMLSIKGKIKNKNILIKDILKNI